MTAFDIFALSVQAFFEGRKKRSLQPADRLQAATPVGTNRALFSRHRDGLR
jgi:hypothetical protein